MVTIHDNPYSKSTNHPYSYWSWVIAYTRKRKIKNNTWVEHLEGDPYPKSIREVGAIGITFHRTRIIELYPDGTIQLRNNGWDTSTTRDRFSEYIFSVSSISTWSGKWFIWFRGSYYEFKDEMMLRPPPNKPRLTWPEIVIMPGSEVPETPSDPREWVKEVRREQWRARRKRHGVIRPHHKVTSIEDWDILVDGSDILYVHDCKENERDQFAAIGRTTKKCKVCRTELPKQIRMLGNLQRIQRRG